MAETSGSCAYNLSFGKSQYYTSSVMPRNKENTVVDTVKKNYEKRQIFKEEEIAKKIEAKPPESRTDDEKLFLFSYKTKVATEKLANKLGNINTICHFDAVV